MPRQKMVKFKIAPTRKVWKLSIEQMNLRPSKPFPRSHLRLVGTWADERARQPQFRLDHQHPNLVQVRVVE